MTRPAEEIEKAHKKTEEAKDAWKKAWDDCNQAVFTEVKKAVEKGEIPRPAKGNAPFKAKQDAKSNEPGPMKVGGASYVPSLGQSEMPALKTTMPNFDAGATSQGAVSTGLPMQPPAVVYSEPGAVPTAVSAGLDVSQKPTPKTKKPATKPTTKPGSQGKPTDKPVAHPKGCTCKECAKQ